MITATFLSLSLLASPDSPGELEALETALRAAVARVNRSVVTITTRGGVRKVDIPDRLKGKMSVPGRPRDPREPPEERPGEEPDEDAPEGRTPRFKNEWEKMLALPGFKKAEGPTTGLVVSSDGHIVTSAWNFDSKPNVIVVTFADGSSRAARLLGIDRAAGLALVKVDAEGLPVPQFRDPEDVRVGAWAFALGRTLSQDYPEVKYGVISAKNRIDGRALQTDAATSPTNYGGPLIDIRGRIYGVIVPLGARGQEANPNWYDSGIGFAAPIPDPARIVERLGEEGVVLEPAFLGVSMDQDRTEPGARITQVVPDQPAAKAGLREGDVVLEADGEKIENAFAMRFAVGRKRAGEEIELVLQRDGERIETTVELAKRPTPAEAKKLPTVEKG